MVTASLGLAAAATWPWPAASHGCVHGSQLAAARPTALQHLQPAHTHLRPGPPANSCCRPLLPLPASLASHLTIATHRLCFPPLCSLLLLPQELGVQILSDLQRQRETILHSRDTLHTVDTHISRSRQILQTMSRRIIQNKAIMWGIILLLLGAIGLVLWAKF